MTVNLASSLEAAQQVAELTDSTKRAKTKLIEDGRAFFCSELVVKAFKVCGILLPTNEACSNFLPVDLHSASDKLRLVSGARLGREQLIFTETMFNSEQ